MGVQAHLLQGVLQVHGAQLGRLAGEHGRAGGAAALPERGLLGDDAVQRVCQVPRGLQLSALPGLLLALGWPAWLRARRQAVHLCNLVPPGLLDWGEILLIGLRGSSGAPRSLQRPSVPVRAGASKADCKMSGESAPSGPGWSGMRHP